MYLFLLFSFQRNFVNPELCWTPLLLVVSSPVSLSYISLLSLLLFLKQQYWENDKTTILVHLTCLVYKFYTRFPRHKLSAASNRYPRCKIRLNLYAAGVDTSYRPLLLSPFEFRSSSALVWNSFCRYDRRISMLHKSAKYFFHYIFSIAFLSGK